MKCTCKFQNHISHSRKQLLPILEHYKRIRHYVHPQRVQAHQNPSLNTNYKSERNQMLIYQLLKQVAIHMLNINSLSLHMKCNGCSYCILGYWSPINKSFVPHNKWIIKSWPRLHYPYIRTCLLLMKYCYLSCINAYFKGLNNYIYNFPVLVNINLVVV